MNNKKIRLNLQHFAMKNKDVEKATRDEILQKMNAAIAENNTEDYAQAFELFANSIQESVLAEYEQTISSNDASLLAMRGSRQLTSKETEFYQKTIDAMKGTNPKQALTDMDVVMPETIIDSVFKDLETEHELLSVINFQNTSAITKMLLNTHGNQLATWDALCTEIVTEITSGFKMIDMSLNKLTAFIPICKDMLDLGPIWLDRYVRKILAEAIAFGLEEAIINGTGKNQPIGMNRQVGDDVTVTAGVYPLKTAVDVTALDPVAYGDLLSKLSTFDKAVIPGATEEDDPTVIKATRTVKNVLMIVNPTDYLTKIMPATTIRGTDGLYRSDVLPFPTRIIQSTQVPKNKMIVGLADKYFMGIGSAKTGKIEYSDEAKFLEDQRLYKTKLYGHGQALDNSAFIYCNIENLKPAVVKVEVTEEVTA